MSLSDVLSAGATQIHAMSPWIVLLLKATLLLAVAWLLNVALIRANPRWQVLLWRGVAVGLVLLAMGTFGLPGFEIRVRPSAYSTFSPPDTTEHDTTIAHSLPATPAARPDDVDLTATVPPGPAEGPVEAVRPEPHAAHASTWPWQACIVGIWSAGVAWLLVRLAIGYVRLTSLMQDSEIAPDDVVAKARGIAELLGCRRAVQIRIGRHFSVPFLYGWRHPVIVLPQRMCEPGYREQVPGILAHELVHVRSNDYGWNAVLQAVSMLLWFHPLAWRMGFAHRAACDSVCDAVSATHLGDVRAYCRTLALVAVESAGRLFTPGLAMARTCDVRRRIAVLEWKVFASSLRRRSVASFALIGLCACILLAGLRFALADPATEAKDQPSSTEADAKANAWQPGQTLDFRVINAKTKEPLPDVKLDLQFSGTGINFQDIKVQHTDAQGQSEIRLPDLKPNAVRVYPSKAGFVPMRVFWGSDDNPVDPPIIPKTVTIPMEPGTVWGGIVQNEKGEPIPDVKVCVHYWEKGTEFNPHLRVNICVEDTIRTTDKEGRWQLDILPAEFTDEGPRLFLTHPDYVSDHLQRGCTPNPITERPSYESLRAQTAVMVMRKGTTIAGRVTDESGNPISGALICNQYDCYAPDPLKITTTADNEGHFRLSGLSHRQNYRDYFFTVQAAGYAPVFVEVSDHDSAKPAEIKLKRGQTVQGQVVDENGKPLEGVSIKLDYWMGRPRQFHLQTTTDVDGKFCINDAPMDRAEYNLRKNGYATVEHLLMLPLSSGQAGTTGHTVVLKSPLWVAGAIVDAETNQPLEKCTLTKGWDPDGRAPEWETQLGLPAKTVTDGRYEFELTQGRSIRIRVEAEGYMPAVSRIFKAGGDSDKGRVTYDFRMTKAVPMSGTVLGLDGKPLADAEVFLAKQQFVVENGTANHNARRTSVMAKTDANGRFEFSPEVEPFYLVVLHEQGHIVLDEKQFATTPTVRIAPWQLTKRSFLLQRKQINYSGNAPENEPQTLNVRIVDAEGNPVEGANVASSAEFRAGYNYLGDNEPAWDYFRNVMSDQDGRARVADQYRIDCVVARHVERKLVAIQSISPNQVGSSETVTITLHPQCKAFGRLTAKELEARNRPMTFRNVYLYQNDGMGRPMSCMSGKDDFHFYLPPGTYKLDAYGTDTQHVRIPITVKPGQEELEVEPIDLPPTGLVLLEGKPAPELRDVVAWKNGGPVKLADLQGKVVILAFSTHWAASRPHDWMPNLFTISDKYRDQGLAIIDVRLDMGNGIDSQAKLDEKIAKVKSPFWDDRDLPIPIALGLSNRPPFLRSAEEKEINRHLPCAILKDYGINGFPSGVLIDRQGRVVGKFDLRSDRDNAVLEKMLNEK